MIVRRSAPIIAYCDLPVARRRAVVAGTYRGRVVPAVEVEHKPVLTEQERRALARACSIVGRGRMGL